MGHMLKAGLITPGFSPSFGAGIPVGGLETLSQLAKSISLSIFCLARSDNDYEGILKLGSAHGMNISRISGKQIIPKFLANSIVHGYPSPSSLVVVDDLSFLHTLETIITIEPFSYISYQLLQFSKRHNKRLITLSFENLPFSPLLNLPPYSFYTHAIRDSKCKIWAATQTTAQCLISKGFDPSNISVCHFGLNLDRYDVKREDHDNFTFLYVGGLTKNKGFIELVRAFEIASKMHNNLNLIVCGDGPLREWLMERIVYASGRIIYKGTVEHSELPKIYSMADVFVLPSKSLRKFGLKIWEEQFGMALVEAMASGLPIITTRTGSIPEIVGNNNFLIADANIQNLVTSMIAAMSTHKVKLREIGTSNRELVRRRFNAIDAAGKIAAMLID